MRRIDGNASESPVDLPPPRPEGRFDRLIRWIQARRWLVLILLVILGTWMLLAVVIGVIFLGGTSSNYVFAAALNKVLVVFMAMAFPMIQRGIYRWVWHVDRRRASGSLSVGEEPRFQSEATEPTPLIAWPMLLRIRHALMNLAAMLGVTVLFLPFEHQVRIAVFIAQHSDGSATAGSLNELLFGWIPMILSVGVLMLLTYRQLRRRDAGSLDGCQQLLLRAELNWLTAYGAAFTTVVVLCHMIGNMTLLTFLRAI